MIPWWKLVRSECPFVLTRELHRVTTWSVLGFKLHRLVDRHGVEWQLRFPFGMTLGLR